MKQLILVLLFLINCDALVAQTNVHWKEIGTFDLGWHAPEIDIWGNVSPQGIYGNRISCVFFWDENSGLVAQGSWWIPPYMQPRILITTDGGKNWKRARTPEIYNIPTQGSGFGGDRPNIESIWMDNIDTGYAVITLDHRENDQHYDLWRTIDGGDSWDQVDLPPNTIGLPSHIPHSVDQRICVNNAKTNAYGTPILIDGALDFFDSLRGVAIGEYAVGASFLYKTSDGGRNWIQNPYPSIAPRGLKCQTTTGNIYALPGFSWQDGDETQSDQDRRKVVRSKNGGANWESTALPNNIVSRGAMVDGAGSAIYIAGYNAQNQALHGFWRSTDEGTTWKHVGGPLIPMKTRFHVPETCNGSIVVAFDSMSVWMTTDGGDGTLPSDRAPVITMNEFAQIPACIDTVATLVIQNLQCRAYVFERAELIDPENAFEFDTVGVFPIDLNNASADQIRIRFKPQFRPKMFTGQVKLIGYEVETDGTKRAFDTTIAIDAVSLAVPPSMLSDRRIFEFSNTSTCLTASTTITLTNTGCDTLSLDNIAVSGSAYSFSSVATPRLLAPGESVTVTVTFHPTSQGQHFGALEFTGSQQGITRKVDVPLSGVGVVGAGLLELQSASDVKLPEFSICASGDDTLATLRNTGCDTIIVKNVVLSGTSDYALADAINDVILPPDSSLSFRVAFTPRDKGARNGTVTITWTDERGNDPRDITITMSATVIDGTRALASSISTIDFGETNICEERDSVVRLRNDGCDTLTITDAEIDKNFSFSGDLPIRLAPGESVDLPITTQVDTTGKPTRLTGTLTIASNADNQLAPITLTRGLYYPTKLRIEAVDEASGKAGDEARFRIILDGDVPSTMTALHFDFLHNNDLLSFTSLSGAGLQVVNTVGEADQRQSFTLSPVRAGVLGELSFKAYLAEAEQTTLSFDNITFEAAGVSFAPECIAVISDSGSRFNYVYTCGDDMIRSALRGETLIKSLTPNPATNEIRLELASGVREATIVIVDMLGAEVLRTSRNTIDISQLASGTYYLRVSANGAVQTRRVIVSR